MAKLMTERKLKHVSEDRNEMISVLEQREATPADRVLYKEELWLTVSQAARSHLSPYLTHSSFDNSFSPLWYLTIPGLAPDMSTVSTSV